MENSTGFVGSDPAFSRIVMQAEKLASLDRPVLVRGERGTGKELIARYLHYSGKRKDNPFVVLNCGAFGGDLLQSELFGHEKGAFTGADTRRVGKLEQADGGTIFLDEIGNMSMPFQEKILRVLEYQTFERAGGSQTLHVDVRVIAATNADLERMIDAQTFRADLYDRLNFAQLRVPPLRERRSDIPLLINHFAQLLAAEMPAMEWRVFSAEAIEALMYYYWPGNVRQLRNVIEYVYILGQGESEEIQISELPPELSLPLSTGETFDDQVDAFQRKILIHAINEHHRNQKNAAESLGLTYDRFRHLYKKLKIRDFLP